MSQIIRIATYNIRNTMDRYPERKEFLKKTIQSIKSDIMGMQEVGFIGENNQLKHLVEESIQNNTQPKIEGQPLQQIYNCYNARQQIAWQNCLTGQKAKECNLDGNTVIVSKDFIQEKGKVLEEQVIHLSSVQVAQYIKLQFKNGVVLYFVNTHLHSPMEDKSIRLHQMQQVIQWLKIQIPDYENANIVITGDFNADPNEPTYSFLEKDENFNSTHKYIHKKEPKITFPTGLQAPNMDIDPPNCFDYIWYKGKDLQPQDCEIFGNIAHESDDTIYPSDHMGLVSTFKIQQQS